METKTPANLHSMQESEVNTIFTEPQILSGEQDQVKTFSSLQSTSWLKDSN